MGNERLMSAVQPASCEPFSLSVVPSAREVAVVAAGELDLASGDVLERAVRQLYSCGVDRVVIDLRRVGFLSSTGLRVLLSLRNDAKRNGRSLTLVPGPAAVQRVFELTATRGLFDWRDA